MNAVAWRHKVWRHSDWRHILYSVRGSEVVKNKNINFDLQAMIKIGII